MNPFTRVNSDPMPKLFRFASRVQATKGCVRKISKQKATEGEHDSRLSMLCRRLQRAHTIDRVFARISSNPRCPYE